MSHPDGPDVPAPEVTEPVPDETSVVEAAEKQSLEERLKGAENRLKGLTILVAAVALVVTGLSAYSAVRSANAAERSAETAQKMRDIAQATLDTAGAVVEVDPTIKLTGHCDKTLGQPTVATITVRNRGRTGTEISRIQIGSNRNIILLTGTERAVMDFRMSTPQKDILLGEKKERVNIEGQHGVDLDIPIDCSQFAQAFVSSTDGSPQPPVKQLVVTWYGPSMGTHYTFVDRVVLN